MNGMVGQIEMSRNWFRSAIIANVIKVLMGAITEATTPFSNIELIAQFALYAVNDIGRKANKMVRDFVRRFSSGNGGLRKKL